VSLSRIPPYAPESFHTMMLRETVMQIKYLARQGMAKTGIAERLGISRQTVYNHLNRTEPFPKPRKERPSKLHSFHDFIRARLEKFDLPATTLLRELRVLGYQGSLTILRDFMRPLKAEFVRRVTERFETLPGQQAQIDWGECGTITVDGQARKLYVFVMVLGYSRMMYAHFTTSTRLPALLGCLGRAFQVLGVPAELLVDNMKQAVDQHDVTTGTVRWNKQFLDFCEHFSVLPVASPPYWPRVKGKVERGVGYLKTSFLEGRSFTDLDDLNRQLHHWLDTVANVRIHGTTHERPIDRQQREWEHLRPAAAVPVYDVRPVEFRKVASDCHFSFGAVRYSVPPEACGHTVTIRPSGDRIGSRLSAYLGEGLLVEHRVAPKGSGAVTLPAHAAAIRKLTRGDPARRRGRPTKQPAFEQVAHDGLGLLSPSAIPIVQAGALDVYERLLEGAA
jgi:transposase